LRDASARIARPLHSAHTKERARLSIPSRNAFRDAHRGPPRTHPTPKPDHRAERPLLPWKRVAFEFYQRSELSVLEGVKTPLRAELIAILLPGRSATRECRRARDKCGRIPRTEGSSHRAPKSMSCGIPEPDIEECPAFFSTSWLYGSTWQSAADYPKEISVDPTSGWPMK
jgi:hypothetical protein